MSAGRHLKKPAIPPKPNKRRRQPWVSVVTKGKNNQLRRVTRAAKLAQFPWQDWEQEYCYTLKPNGTFFYQHLQTFAAAKKISYHDLNTVAGGHQFEGLPYHGDWNVKRVHGDWTHSRVCQRLVKSIAAREEALEQAAMPADWMLDWMRWCQDTAVQIRNHMGGVLLSNDPLPLDPKLADAETERRWLSARRYTTILERILRMFLHTAELFAAFTGIEKGNNPGAIEMAKLVLINL